LIKGVLYALKTGVQKGSVMSKNITPTLWLRLLRRKRAIAFGVTEFLGGFFYALFVAGAMLGAPTAIVQHDRNRGGREAAGLRDIPHGDGLVLSALPLHAWASGGTIIWCLRFELQRGAFTEMALGLLGGRFKRHGLAETGCFPSPVNQPQGHPHGAQFFCRHTELQEDVATKFQSRAAAIVPATPFSARAQE